MVGNGSGHDRTCTNCGEATDVTTCDHDRAGADRAPLRQVDLGHGPVVGRRQGPIRRDAAWEAIVGQHCGRADEDTRRHCHTVIDERVVLDLDAIADADAGVDVRAAAHDAFVSENDAFTNPRRIPYARARAHEHAVRYLGGGVDQDEPPVA